MEGEPTGTSTLPESEALAPRRGDVEIHPIPLVASWSDRAILVCLKALFFLVPVTMLNWTGFGLGQYSFDVFNTAKMVVFRVLILVAVGIWLWAILMNGGTVRQTKFDWWIVGLLGWMAVTTALSVHPATSLFGRYTRYDGLFTYVGYAALFFLCIQVLTDEQRVRSLARMVSLSGLLVGVYGVMQAAGADPFKWGTVPFAPHMAFSTLGNPDTLGGYIVFPLVVSIALALSDAATGWKVVHWVTSLFVIACWLATFSRGAWVGGLVGLVLLVVVFFRQRRKLGAIDLGFLCLMAVSAAGVIAISARSADAVTNFASRLSSITAFGEGSAKSRLQIWGSSLEAIRHRPIFGWGPDTFRFAFGRYRTSAFVAHNGIAATVDNAHNYALQLATTIGIPGALLFHTIDVSALWSGGRRLLASGVDTADGLLRGGFLAAGVGFLAYLLFGFPIVSSGSLLWLTLALLTEPQARTREIHRRAWGTWAAWGVTAMVCLLVVASALLMEADYFYAHGRRATTQEAAAKDVRKAVALNPFNDAYRIGAAVVASEAFGGRYAEYTQQAVGAAPDTNARAGLQAAFDEAVRDWEDSLKFNPREQDNYVNLAMIYNAWGYVDPSYYAKAVAIARRGLQVAPATPVLRLEMAKGLFASGDKQGALRSAEAAAAIDPTYVDPRLLIADIYVQMGDLRAAERVYEEILKASPDDQRAGEGLARVREQTSPDQSPSATPDATGSADGPSSP